MADPRFFPGANLRGANLRGADLRESNLRGADLRESNLRGADLLGANLRGANLRWADLRGANLSGADLRGADLFGANLLGANLRGANLLGVNLRGANLSGADLLGANLPGYQIPQTGTLEVWKKLRGGVIALMRVPADAARTASMVGRKCRAERVVVLELSEGQRAHSLYCEQVVYEVGKEIHPIGAPYDPDPRVECAPGIHFFLTRKEAEEYE